MSSSDVVESGSWLSPGSGTMSDTEIFFRVVSFLGTSIGPYEEAWSEMGVGTKLGGKSNFGGATGDIGERSGARKRDSGLTSSIFKASSSSIHFHISILIEDCHIEVVMSPAASHEINWPRQYFSNSCMWRLCVGQDSLNVVFAGMAQGREL
jgi:hypothetical protein